MDKAEKMETKRSVPPGKGPIAVFASFSGHGGVEKMLIHLCSGFAASGFEVDLLAVKTRSRYLASVPPGVRVVPFKTGHTYWSLAELVRYLKARKPAALLAAKDRANQTAILARMMSRAETRIVVRMGTTISEALLHKGPMRRWAWALPIHLLYPKADGIVAVSRGVADDLVHFAGLPRDSISVLPNPVITPSLYRQAEEPVDHSWLNEKDRPVILGMGRLTLQKDFPTLLEAVARLRTSIPCRLIILGEGRDKKNLQARARELGIQDAVDLPGFRPNPYPYLKRASVFVLSSIWEGSPNALTEALALGTPVVATDCPSGPKEILQDGAVAPLVPMQDPDAMARAILDTLENPPDKERLQQAAAPYTVENSARRYLEVLLGKAP